MIFGSNSLLSSFLSPLSICNFILVPVKFAEKYSVVKVKNGESVRLLCNATGDLPLEIQWTKGNMKLDKLGNNYEIINTEHEDGLRSELYIHTTKVADAAVYKCFAENEFGKDERLIKLEVVQVPDAPKNLRMKDVWSRTVNIVWGEAFNGNLPITRYIIQYWRYQNAPHRLHELIVEGSQSSVFIKDLTPGQTYELSMQAENEIGKGASTNQITFKTGEEEPSAPPNDITAEALGPTTIRVTWYSPPIENWNGEIRGYYIGYRKASEPNAQYVYKLVSINEDQITGRGAAVATSNKKEIAFHEYFIRQLAKETEYSIVVKAHNAAGSGPVSHEVIARTFDGKLPPQLQLSVIDTTDMTISLRWHQKLHGALAVDGNGKEVTSYLIHYKKVGEPKWRQVPISVPMSASPDPNNFFNSYSFVLEGPEANNRYKIYVNAVNRFGVGDPSNIVLAATVNGKENRVR